MAVNTLRKKYKKFIFGTEQQYKCTFVYNMHWSLQFCKQSFFSTFCRRVCLSAFCHVTLMLSVPDRLFACLTVCLYTFLDSPSHFVYNMSAGVSICLSLMTLSPFPMPPLVSPVCVHLKSSLFSDVRTAAKRCLKRARSELYCQRYLY
jgi:hypothetical protein